MTVRINKQKINLREKLTEFEDKVNFDEVVRGLGEYTGNVGIGTTSPAAKLHIRNTLLGDTGMVIENTNNAQNLDIDFYSNVGITQGRIRYQEGSGSFEINPNVSGGSPFTITYGGNVGIGTTNPNSGAKLEVQADSNGAAGIAMRHTGANSGNLWRMYMRGNSDLVISTASSVGVQLVFGQTSWQAESDESLKNNISELGPVLDKVKNYRCINYSLISNEMTEANAVGFIAQDWASDFPNIVSSDEDGKLSMKYTETIPVLMKAIQEQQTIIEDLKSRIETLESK